MYYKNDHKYEMTFLLLDNAIIAIGNETFLKNAPVIWMWKNIPGFVI